MKKYNGVTMIVLVLTILVIIIISGVTIATAGSLLENSKVTTFAEDLKSVEDATKMYYIENDDLPVLGENIALSYAQVKSLVESKNLSFFETETIENEDKPTSDSLGAFYKIDLAKIGATKVSRGIEENGDTSDVFVVSYPSMNVYYLKGLLARSKAYFSLTKEISNVTKINKGDIANINTSTVTASGITVKKEKKTWTNKPAFLIEASISSGETLYIKFGGSGAEKQLRTVVGQNSIYFSDNLNSYTLNGTKYNLSITDTEVSNFDNLVQSNKFFEVIKKKGSSVIGKLKVDMSNYEKDLPIKSAQTTFTPGMGYNTLTINVNDNTSGIKDVKYEYLTKFDKSGNIIKYYKNKEGKDITSFNSDYMISRGKSAKFVSDGVYQIEVPTDVEGIEIMVYDKAGNSFLMTENTNLQNTSAEIWAGIYEKYVANTQISLDLTAKTKHQINVAKVQISDNGSIYGEEKFVDFVNTSSNVWTSSVSFDSLNLSDYVYVKLVITYNNRSKTTTVIKKIKVKQDDDYEMAMPGVTVLGENKKYVDSQGNSAIIPTGFKISVKENEQNISSGLVVIAPDESEFVWVPVPENEINLFAKNDGTGNMNGLLYNYSKYGDINGTLVTNRTEPIVTTNDNKSDNLNIINNILGTKLTTSKDLKELMQDEYNAIYESVNKYHGFYIGRYETANMMNYNNTIILSVVSKANMTDINNQNWYTWYANEKKYASTLTGVNVRSNMIYGSQWYAVMRYFAKNSDDSIKEYPINAEKQGNFSEKLEATGKSVSVNNIYDMAGNVEEYTCEKINGNVALMGGHYKYTDYNEKYAGRIGDNESTTIKEEYGSRMCLYL